MYFTTPIAHGEVILKLRLDRPQQEDTVQFEAGPATKRRFKETGKFARTARQERRSVYI